MSITKPDENNGSEETQGPFDEEKLFGSYIEGKGFSIEDIEDIEMKSESEAESETKDGPNFSQIKRSLEYLDSKITAFLAPKEISLIDNIYLHSELRTTEELLALIRNLRQVSNSNELTKSEQDLINHLQIRIDVLRNLIDPINNSQENYYNTKLYHLYQIFLRRQYGVDRRKGKYRSSNYIHPVRLSDLC